MGSTLVGSGLLFLSFGSDNFELVSSFLATGLSSSFLEIAGSISFGELERRFGFKGGFSFTVGSSKVTPMLGDFDLSRLLDLKRFLPDDESDDVRDLEDRSLAEEHGVLERLDRIALLLSEVDLLSSREFIGWGDFLWEPADRFILTSVLFERDCDLFRFFILVFLCLFNMPLSADLECRLDFERCGLLFREEDADLVLLSEYSLLRFFTARRLLEDADRWVKDSPCFCFHLVTLRCLVRLLLRDLESSLRLTFFLSLDPCFDL